VINSIVSKTTTRAKNLCLGEMFLIISEIYWNISINIKPPPLE